MQRITYNPHKSRILHNAYSKALLKNWKKRLEEGDSTAEPVREKRFVQPFKDQVIDLNPQAFLDIEASVNAHQQVCRSYASGDDASVLNQKKEEENAGC
ncbi:hypothetical protein CDAR_428891 [Caerostris darwini]|uniref:Transposase n=1 Tax=Caerostris darwini TaxID=1538125 RepID=A0AAV4V6D8_9ARAC|nr:hypothetical protein CDAR_428891 [Caerostris darwini]